MEWFVAFCTSLYCYSRNKGSDLEETKCRKVSWDKAGSCRAVGERVAYLGRQFGGQAGSPKGSLPGPYQVTRLEGVLGEGLLRTPSGQVPNDWALGTDSELRHLGFSPAFFSLFSSLGISFLFCKMTRWIPKSVLTLRFYVILSGGENLGG